MKTLAFLEIYADKMYNKDRKRQLLPGMLMEIWVMHVHGCNCMIQGI